MAALDFIIGKRIQNRLEELGMTQSQLADMLDTSRQVINKLVHGRKSITVKEIHLIAEALQMKPEELIQEDNVETEEKEPIMAFMGEVKSETAKEGLKKAQKIMDIILFHRDIQEEHHKLLSE